MIEPTSYEQAKKLLRLSGPSHLAALAWLDGYEGIDNLSRQDALDRDFYETYWLKGSFARDATPP